MDYLACYYVASVCAVPTNTLHALVTEAPLIPGTQQPAFDMTVVG